MRKEEKIILVLLFFSILALGSVVFGVVSEENFNSYTGGSVVGQGNWYAGPMSDHWQVNSAKTYEGAKSIRCPTGDFCGTSMKPTNASTTGSWRVWAYFSGSTCNDETALYLGKNIGDHMNTIQWWRTELATSTCTIEPTGEDLIFNEWVSSDLEWIVSATPSESVYRTRFNEGSWTSWINFAYSYATTTDFIGTAILYARLDTGATTIYVDYFSERPDICESEHCYECETYDTCINANCSWWYSIFLQEWYCVDYIEPEEEECGPFFKCQFCTTQELCEAELNCEWKNIGYGDQCYLIEPELPPDQVIWEVPELDECATTGVEMWLCEIKNFVAGIFMPSQEKIDDLYQTIGAFKEKFPFNYASEMNLFFDDINESLDVEKEISIKILNQTSTISFAFWNSTTSIGGVEETFKNIIIDFTSIVIFMGWFVWLISLIRRFFQ